MRAFAIPPGRHILLTADAVGGVWDFACTLAGALRQRGTPITLLVLGTPSAAQERLLPVGVDLITAPLKLEWMDDSAADIASTRVLVARLVRERGVDVLHASQFAAACADVDVPVVLTIHSDLLSWRAWAAPANAGAPAPDAWRAYVALVREALARADASVAVSRFLANEVQARYGGAQPPLVIPNGWPAPEPLPAPDAPRDRLTMLAGRAWDSAKNIGLAAQAAQGWAPGRVLLAGEQHHPESGGALPVAPPLEPAGFLPQPALAALFARARVFLSPARYEPFGLTPLQAALAGCALLLSDIPSFRELWGGAALFFRSDNAADLHGAWQRLLNDEAARLDLARRAQARALERYAARRMAEEYLALYAQLLAERRPVLAGSVR